jgi:hydrogenase maturation factor
VTLDPTVTIDAERCITCGDLAVVATVVEVRGLTAAVEADGRREDVAIELVEPVAPGDLLLCHAGIALERITGGGEAA